jgi:hypothetical protein
MPQNGGRSSRSWGSRRSETVADLRGRRRREFIAGIGGAAALPLAGRAQQQPVSTIGFLHEGSPEGYGILVEYFRKQQPTSFNAKGRSEFQVTQWDALNGASENGAAWVKLGTTGFARVITKIKRLKAKQLRRPSKID